MRVGQGRAGPNNFHDLIAENSLPWRRRHAQDLQPGAPTRGGSPREQRSSSALGRGHAGAPPAGPANKRKPIRIVLDPDAHPVAKGKLCGQHAGFNLHGATKGAASDEQGRLALCKYILRPPLANDRLKLLDDEVVRLEFKKPWSDGTFAIEMDALALLARLASSVPPPKQHLTRYSGVLAAAARWRPLIIPPDPSDPAPPAFTKPQKPPPSGKRCCYIKRAELLRLTFGLTVDQCPACGGRMKLRALVRDPESIERFLRHQSMWSPPPGIAPARAPPYHRSVSRLAPTRHIELFPDA